jgi:hypothetical protein
MKNNLTKLTLLISTLLVSAVLGGCGNKEEPAGAAAGGTADAVAANKADPTSRPLKGVGADESAQKNVDTEQRNSPPGSQ